MSLDLEYRHWHRCSKKSRHYSSDLSRFLMASTLGQEPLFDWEYCSSSLSDFRQYYCYPIWNQRLVFELGRRCPILEHCYRLIDQMYRQSCSDFDWLDHPVGDSRLLQDLVILVEDPKCHPRDGC